MESSPAAATSPTPYPTAAGGGSLISSDFQTFLRMLTAQAQNQDPLNPMDATDYAQQLATFSGVEQQVRTNDLLTALGALFDQSNTSDLAVWIGQEVRAVMPASYSGQPVDVTPFADPIADRAELVVRDANGNEVSRRSLDLPAEPFEWDGVDADGNALPNGLYSFEVESYLGESHLNTLGASVYGEVAEARLTATGVALVFTDGTEVDAASILAVRRPE